MSLWNSAEYSVFSESLRGKSATVDLDTSASSTPKDEFGRPETTPAEPSAVVAFTPRVDDRISHMTPPWNGAQLASALKASERGDMSRLAELMDHMKEMDGKLAGFMQARELAAAGVDWYCAPSDKDDKEAVEIAKFVEAEIRNIQNFEHGFRAMHDAIGKGVACMNIGWQRGGRTPQSRWRIDSFDWINTRRVRFDWKAERLLIIPDEHLDIVDDRQLPFDEIASLGLGVPPGRWDVLIHRSRMRTTHPGKGGVLRILVFYFLFRNLAIKEWFNFANVYGTPFRLGKLPPGSTDDDKNEMLQALARLGKDGAAVIDHLATIEFLESKQVAGGRAEPPFASFRDACAKEMEFAILGQEQTNTENATGNRAKTEAGGAKVKQDILEADCIDDQMTIRFGLCKPIVGFSRYGWLKARTKLPYFRMRYKPQKDFRSMAEEDTALHGDLGLPSTVGALAERYERTLPDGVDPDTVMVFGDVQWPGLEGRQVVYINAAQPQADPEAPDDEDEPTDPDDRRDVAKLLRARGKGLRGKRAPSRKAQLEIDDYTDRATDLAVRSFERLPDALQRIVSEVIAEGKGMDLGEVQRRVLTLTPDDLDDGGTFETLVRRAAGTMRLLGMSTVRKPPPVVDVQNS